MNTKPDTLLPGLPARHDGACATCGLHIEAGVTRIGYLRGEQICVACMRAREEEEEA